MPFPNYHTGRVRNPDLFARIVVLKTTKEGILIKGGPLKSNPQGPSKRQAFWFPKNKFTPSQARKWLKDKNIKIILFEKATNTTSTQSMRVILDCVKLQAEKYNILDLIPPGILNEIKEKDKHPFFQLYSICHEGMSKPKLLGRTSKPISWSRQAIQSIKNIITKGVKLFKGHSNDDNSIKGRRELGKIIHSFDQEINGKLHHLAITYHPENVREEVKNYDMCSQEADWNLIESAGNLVAETIEKLTAVVLGKSQDNPPAFAGAKKLGMIQAFEAVETKEKKTMTYEEIRDELLKFSRSSGERINLIKGLLNDFGLHPRHIFTLEQLKEDHDFSKFFQEKDELTEKKSTLEKQLEVLQDENKKLERNVLIKDAKIRLINIAKDMQLQEPQIKFVEDQFNENQEDLTDEGLKQFVESQKGIIKKVMSYHGNTEDIPLETSDGMTKDPKDLTKKENNPILTEDFNV
jgi:hypothetical protein